MADEPNIKNQIISLPDLLKRWQTDNKWIKDLCFAKKLIPYRNSVKGVVYKLHSKTVIVFSKPLSRNESGNIKLSPEGQKFVFLPEDSYFKLPNILEIEGFRLSNLSIIEGRQKAVTEMKAYREPFNNLPDMVKSFTDFHLLKFSIADWLIIQDKGEKHRYFCLYSARRLLEVELTKVKERTYKNEAKRKKRENKILGKIDEINWHLAETQTVGRSDQQINLITQTEQRSTENGTKREFKRRDNLSLAIYAAIKTLGGKPSFDELWHFFQEDKDETGHILDFTVEKITWATTKGKVKDTQKESLANRLSRIKV